MDEARSVFCILPFGRKHLPCGTQTGFFTLTQVIVTGGMQCEAPPLHNHSDNCPWCLLLSLLCYFPRLIHGQVFLCPILSCSHGTLLVAPFFKITYFWNIISYHKFQWLLVHSQIGATITTANFRTLPSPYSYMLVVTPLSSTHPFPNYHYSSLSILI